MSVKHTPGPWAWFGNRSGGVYLATVNGGRKYVMGFKRYGMNGAQPIFCCNDRMVPAADLVEFAVGDGMARGFKQADQDGSVYRYDVSGIDNADARLIAAAPCMASAGQSLLASLDPDTLNPEQFNAWSDLQAAIAKAAGQ